MTYKIKVLHQTFSEHISIYGSSQPCNIWFYSNNAHREEFELVRRIEIHFNICLA